jgi:hypothetical protein
MPKSKEIGEEMEVKMFTYFLEYYVPSDIDPFLRFLKIATA